ncbi:molybdate ABC transporter substrate-binding protein [Thiosocius teredinicola]|uniref:molybdate ABC transporter substrate-binding protein n=1 Tax=Thiosocius teredinicola TaxID=1973002 RepID=UPI00099139DB
MRNAQRLLRSAVAWAALMIGATASGDQVNVAVAANFTAAMKEVAAGFEKATGHKAVLSFGSTGKLYAQILHGAPFGVFLAADQERPRKLVEAGKASGQFTYANGKLVLWSKQEDLIGDTADVLKNGGFKRLAIANPKTAPYGVAAMQVLDSLGIAKAVRPKLVRGDSIAQTHQFAATGNTELGFVALAQVVLSDGGSRWIVPQEMYDPIRQDAVLLAKGTDQPAAAALLDYLKGDEARAIIERYGYGLE